MGATEDAAARRVIAGQKPACIAGRGTGLLYGARMRRFEDLIGRQLAIFREDYADLLAACSAAERAYDRAGAEEAEERYAAFLELVEEGSEALSTISFALKNLSSASLGSLQVNALFRQVSDPAVD